MSGGPARIDFVRAFYVKLGRAGCWEQNCIDVGRLRLGWDRQTVQDINAGNWDRVHAQLLEEHAGDLRVASNDTNRLRDIATSGPEDVWITFFQAKLWWTRLAAGPVEEDAISKLRRTELPWSDRAADGRLLVANELPGKLTQLQGFRGAACAVRAPDVLKRILNGQRSSHAEAIAVHRTALVGDLTAAIRELQWKDFETLVDLVFRDSGWRRVSVLGQHAKAYDLELREPVTGNRCVVQVKSRGGRAELEQTLASFSADDYHRVFFIVHSPSRDLQTAADVPEYVELVPPERLAELAIEAGLIGWLEDKVS